MYAFRFTLQDNVTPLMHAARYGNLSSMSRLIQAGANLEAQDTVRAAWKQ